MTPSTTQSSALAALRAFLVAILPSTVEVLLSQENKVAEPESDDFVMMTPMGRPRLSTNFATSADCGFVASAAGNVLTVSSMITGTILVGALVQGSALRESPKIVEQTGGAAGGVGTYRLSEPQDVIASETMQTGVIGFEQSTQFEVQLDLHGPNSADNAQTVSTLFRSPYATAFFSARGAGQPSPLYADDPRQAPFLNGEQQYENRWVLQAMLQVSPVVSVPQQFADSAVVVPVSVDAEFPPGG